MAPSLAAAGASQESRAQVYTGTSRNVTFPLSEIYLTSFTEESEQRGGIQGLNRVHGGRPRPLPSQLAT